MHNMVRESSYSADVRTEGKSACLGVNAMAYNNIAIID